MRRLWIHVPATALSLGVSATALTAQTTSEAQRLLDAPASEVWQSSSRDASRFALAAGVLTIEGETEWITTRKSYADVEVTFEAKTAPRAIGGVLVRAIAPPRFARAAYEVQLADGKERPGALLVHRGTEVRQAVDHDATALPSNEAWHPYRIVARGNTLQAWIGGRPLVNVHGLAQNLGAIGFRVTRGEIAVRNLLVRELDLPRPDPPPGVVKADADGVTLPKVRKEVRPKYDNAALSAGIQGTVLVAVVIGVDGRVRDVQVYRSLAAGLDERAKIAAAGWLFEPAVLDGRPIASQATIELSFSMK